jgi:predicted unusual protein kinase regulating ubiquinone biosynthesis (AarF/ABC1/UbiB family)
MNNNKSTITGKVKRYAKVGSKITSVTARVASRKIVGNNDINKNADIILNALGGLKGPLMKVAQLLSTIPDALPKEYADKLQTLQAEAPSMGWFFVKRRMTSELGKDWMKKFDSFENNAKNAASLGQVHKAIVNGNDIACKLQYPDMISTVDADLKQLKLIFSLYGTWDKTIKTKDIYNELSERLREELDYKREFKNMLLFSEILKDQKHINIPIPIRQLSTSRLLTMSWLKGDSFMNWKNSSSKIKNHLALTLFYAWYIPFYKYGIIHGDPHPGNYQVDDSNINEPKINLLDFGCIRVFPANFVKGVIDLYIAMRDNNQELAIKAYKSWGFNNLSKDLINVLNIWALYIYGPLLENKKRQIHDPKAKKNGKEVASNVYKELKKLGGVSPPKEFVLIDRAAVGLGSVFMHLNAKLNWHKIIEELTENFDEKKLYKRQKNILKKFKIDQN